MVFKTKPFRQSVFLSPEPASAARSEILLGAISLLDWLSKASCSRCWISGNTIYFSPGGVLSLDLTPYMKSNVMLLTIAGDPTNPVDVWLTNFEGVRIVGGKIVILPDTDQHFIRRYSTWFVYPLVASDRPTLFMRALQGSTLSLRTIMLTPIVPGFDYSPFILLNYPSNDRIPLDMRIMPGDSYVINFGWNSADDNPATLTYNELVPWGPYHNVAQFTTSSTSAMMSHIYRVRRNNVMPIWSLSSNAVLKQVTVHAYYANKPSPRTRGVVASYSTTSTSAVQYTPLSLTGMHAKIRKIAVSASSNAWWQVNIDGYNNVGSAIGITSFDFNPPEEAYRVDLYLASADGANATATIAIIYDLVPGMLL